MSKPASITRPDTLATKNKVNQHQKGVNPLQITKDTKKALLQCRNTCIKFADQARPDPSPTPAKNPKYYYLNTIL